MTAAEIKFMRKTADYTRLDSKQNLDITRELNKEPVMEFIQSYIHDWKTFFLRIPSSKFSFQIPRYQPKDEDLWEYP
jgi:hypothetical protein